MLQSAEKVFNFLLIAFKHKTVSEAKCLLSMLYPTIVSETNDVLN